MALVKCKECKADVSSFAKVCPKCGIKDPGTKWWHKLVGAVVLVFVIVFLLSRCSSGDSESVQAPEAAAAVIADQSSVTPAVPEPELQVLSLAEQCALADKMDKGYTELLDTMLKKFPYIEMAEAKHENYLALGQWHASYFNPASAKLRAELEKYRASNLTDDQVIRLAYDFVTGANSFVIGYQRFADDGVKEHFVKAKNALIAPAESAKAIRKLCYIKHG
jgi:hypothetical protein